MGKAKTFANLTYDAVHGAARQALRRWNVGFPRLGRTVVVGRVARKDENDFFHVSTGHKRRVAGMSSPGALLARRARLPSPSRDAPPPTAAVARDATTECGEKKT